MPSPAPSARAAAGYTGFAFHAAPDVTLEDDLRRRDLTINAMAMDEHGALIDPYGGARDIAAKTLRHVSEAFAEDPARAAAGALCGALYCVQRRAGDNDPVPPAR